MLARLQNKLPTIRTVHLLLAPALIFIAACLDRQYQTDLWHHLARGQQIVAAGRILDVDVFTYTARGQPLRDANWLTQVMYWRLYAWGGLSLVQVVNAGVLAVTLLVLVRICMSENSRTPAERGANGRVSSRAAAMAGAGVFLGLCPFALIRPQTGSFLLFVLLLAVLMRGGWARWLAIPIMALWANVHGGFAIGLVLIGAFVLESGARIALSLPGRGRGEGGAGPDGVIRSISLSGKSESVAGAQPSLCAWFRHGGERGKKAACLEFGKLTLLLCLSALATCVNPYGWTIYSYATTLTARAAGRGIEEWLPPTLHSTAGWVLLLWIAGLIAAAVAGRRRPTVLQVCLLACFVPPACRAVRMVPWELLATAPMMAGMLAAAGKRWGVRLPRHAAAQRRGAGMEASLSAAMLLVMLLAASVMSLPWLANVNPLFGTVRSNHRVEDDLHAVKIEMAQRGPGRVFTRLEWGDYLSFAAHGENPVFCDGRIELYSDDLWKQYLAVSAGRADFQRILDRWGVDYLVLDAQYHATLLKQIGRNGSWKTVWRSGQVVLLTRTVSRGAVPLVTREHAHDFISQSQSDQSLADGR